MRSFVVPVSIILLLGFGDLVVFYARPDNRDQKNLKEYGINAESIVVGHKKGSISFNYNGTPTNGYYSKCQYNIGDSVRYFTMFTTIKPLPLHEKVLIRYYQRKDGSVILDCVDEDRYKDEYGALP